MTSGVFSPLFRRYLAIAFFTLAMLVGGIGAVMKLTVDRLLYWDATSTAESWARTVLANVRDVDAIARGAVPSTQSMRFLVATHRVRNVFGFQIADLDGNVELISDGAGIVDVHGRQHDPLAARAAALGATVVQLSTGTPPLRPKVYSVAHVPLIVGGQSRAVVAALIDLSEKSDHFRAQFALAAVLLCLVTTLVLCIPAIAWIRQRRDKERAEKRIEYMAGHDTMTALGNRSTLMMLLTRYLQGGAPFALHYVDLDRFKRVNDTFGYAVGDRTIKEVADRLRRLAKPGDVVARLGGDEFAVMQIDAGPEAAATRAGRILESLTQPLRIEPHEITLTASLGCALAPRDGETPERLMKGAALALEMSKRDGRNSARFFAAELDAALEARLKLEQTLRDAVRNELFELYFQPVFRVHDQRLSGFEALLRLRDAEGRLISPAVFIPLAEEIGLIGLIGEWVMREACRNVALWPQHLWVAINVSPVQFQAGSVATQLLAAIAEHGVSPSRLEVEITESVLLGDRPEIVAELHRLKAAGIAVVMDDFGTGYSSMSYLWRFPFDKLKIDRSFMEGYAARSPNIETIIKTIVTMARSLAMRVNVEGIETEAQAGFVAELGCDEMQGFLFGRPLPVTEVAAVIFADFQRTRGIRPIPRLADRGRDGGEPSAELAVG